jgi:hypothetical protein
MLPSGLSEEKEMAQAFDSKNAPMGAKVFGDTPGEALEKALEEHPDAAKVEVTPVGQEKFDSTGDDRTRNNVMRHEYKLLSENEKIDMQAIKDAGLDFYTHLETIASHSAAGGSRELSLAKTKIEEAVMWAVKHVTG